MVSLTFFALSRNAKRKTAVSFFWHWLARTSEYPETLYPNVTIISPCWSLIEGKAGRGYNCLKLLLEQPGTIFWTKILSVRSPSASVKDRVKLSNCWLWSSVVFTDLNFREGVLENLDLLHEVESNNNIENKIV